MLNPIEKFKRSILHLNRSLHHWNACLLILSLHSLHRPISLHIDMTSYRFRVTDMDLYITDILFNLIQEQYVACMRWKACYFIFSLLSLQFDNTVTTVETVTCCLKILSQCLPNSFYQFFRPVIMAPQRGGTSKSVQYFEFFHKYPLWCLQNNI